MTLGARGENSRRHVRATLRSSIVTGCSCVGVMVTVAINGFSFTLPALGLIVAAITGATGWWVGLAMTRHPLLAHLRSAAKDIPLPIPRTLFWRHAEPVGSAGKPV
jgi:hypothetical protein